MANEFTAADFSPHLIYPLSKIFDLVAHVAGIVTIMGAGYHSKMRLRHVYVMVTNAALNATEPIINIQHGGNEVVSTVDMATAIGATAAIGLMAELTIIDAYKDLDADDALQVEVETADGGTAHLLMFFDYELVA